MEGSLEDQAVSRDRQAEARPHQGPQPTPEFEVHAAPDARAAGMPRQAVPRSAAETAPRTPTRLARLGTGVLKVVATALVLLLAALAATVIWDYYVTAPWTRDGRIRVQVASIAPQVSGQITEIGVIDNQFVHKGDVLYAIDGFDFQNALDQAKTQVQMKAADYQVKRVQAERRQHLTTLATTPEEQQTYAGSATQAEAAFKSAQVQEGMAEINLDRTNVKSPVNGYITNFQMRLGDYAHEGTTNISVIDAGSYWVDGYFEETKMSHICVGDHAEAQLMGYPTPILGVVDSVTRGIAVSDAAPGTQGLPNVDPIYTWVRLAQRVPVRMRITEVPAGIPLVSGMTATVTVMDPALEGEGPWWRQRLDGLRRRLADLVDRPAPRPDCVPADGGRQGRTVTIPTPEPAPARTPGEINPGLAPGMTASPEAH